MAAILGWVQRRWNEVLSPVVSTATVQQEADLRALWEQELGAPAISYGVAHESNI